MIYNFSQKRRRPYERLLSFSFRSKFILGFVLVREMFAAQGKLFIERRQSTIIYISSLRLAIYKLVYAVKKTIDNRF